MIDDYIRLRHSQADVEIPAYSLAKLVSFDKTNQCFIISQPDGDNLPFCKVVIVPKTIPAGEVCKIDRAYIDDYHIVLKASEDTVNVGDKVGTTKDSWLAKKYGRGMFEVAGVEGDNLFVRPTVRDNILCFYITS